MILSHDQRALDATLRDGFRYLLGTCRKLAEPNWKQLIEPRLTLIRADFKQRTKGGKS